MKKLAVFCLLLMTISARAIPLSEINIRDPFILADKKTNTYYLYCSSTVEINGKQLGGVAVYSSKDLKDWTEKKQVFVVPEDNWGTGTVWAPEVHYYKGKYYLFATLNSSLEWKKAKEGWPSYTFRGTQIFYSDSPEGPFKAFGQMPHTPIERMCLDGTLYVENGVPYMIYCHEWVQTVDGGMNLIQLADDLSKPVSNPINLFCASAAPWSTGLTADDDAHSIFYVTDGCFLYKTKTNKLLMLWSSFMNGDYALGIAESVTGKITGPWKQMPQPLFNKDGGHGMVFRAFDGKLYLVLHQPNGPSGKERAKLFELEDTGETLVLKQK